MSKVSRRETKTKDFKFFLDKPFWDRGVKIDVSKDGIEVRHDKKNKGIFTIKKLDPNVNKRDYDKVIERCKELAIKKYDELYGKREIYEVNNFSDKHNVVFGVKLPSRSVLRKYGHILKQLKEINKRTYEIAMLNEAKWREDEESKGEWPKGFRRWKLIELNEPEGFETLMRETGIFKEQFEQFEGGEGGEVSIYQKQDAFNDAILKIYPLDKPRYVSDIIQDLEFLQFKMYLLTIDDYRKSDSQRMPSKMKKYLEDKELSMPRKYEMPNKLKSLESVSDLNKLPEIIKTLELERWISSLEDQRDQDIARMKYIYKLSVRKISENLSIARSTVQDRISKLTPPN